MNSLQHLRDWQKKALSSYLQRIENQKVEVTVAYQGSGKTVYTAACFVASVIGDLNANNLSIQKTSIQFRSHKNRKKHFAIIFVPSKSIIESTIEAWESVGVELGYFKNEKLKSKSVTKLIDQGYSGIICTYQQVVKNDTLKLLMNQSPGIKYHTVLDECHGLTIGGKKPANLNAKYFISNYEYFYKLHLITGTPVKQGVKTRYSESSASKIPFIKYLETGEVLPDTFYSQEDAIRDGVIVQTIPVIYSIAKSGVEVDGVSYSLTSEDIEWYIENFSPSAFRNSSHANYEKLRWVLDVFLAICGSSELWKNLLNHGDIHLKKARQIYPLSKGIIFAPSQESAINIHKNLLKGRSVLCISKEGENGGNDFTECNHVKSDKIRSYIKQNEKDIDWIITCEALMQGFDCPDCKVSIIIPRLQFLHLTKISQIIGRTNRAIEGYPKIKATCITLDCKPIEELVKLSQNSEFGICSAVEYASDIIEVYSLDAIEKVDRKIDAHEQGREVIKRDIKVTDIMLSAISKIVTQSGTVLYSYSPEMLERLTEDSIRTYWVNLSLIIHNTPGLSNNEVPPQDPGIYIIVNAKTQECLYVGSGHNLLTRITDKQRYWKNFKWIPIEGSGNVYIKWIVTDNYLDQEILTKKQLSPKYDKEKHGERSLALWKTLWHGWSDNVS